MVDEKDMKHKTFVPEERLEGYPKEEGMLIYSNDFNEVAEELRNIGVCIHEGLSNIDVKMATFEGTLKSLQDQINELHSGESEHKISLSANPTSILGNGKSVSKITAMVTDKSGRAVTGVEVNFVTNIGVINPRKVVTNRLGQAVAQLRSSTTYPPSELIVNPELLKVASSNRLTLAKKRNFVPRIERVDIGKISVDLLPPVIGQTNTRATVTAACDRAVASTVVAFETKQKTPVKRPPAKGLPIRPKTPVRGKIKPSVTPLRSRKIVSNKRK